MHVLPWASHLWDLSIQQYVDSETLIATIVIDIPAQLYTERFQQAFNDITNGTNPGCGTEGFAARPGWDPVTGLGTPNVAKLIELFLELQ